MPNDVIQQPQIFTLLLFSSTLETVTVTLENTVSWCDVSLAQTCIATHVLHQTSADDWERVTLASCLFICLLVCERDRAQVIIPKPSLTAILIWLNDWPSLIIPHEGQVTHTWGPHTFTHKNLKEGQGNNGETDSPDPTDRTFSKGLGGWSGDSIYVFLQRDALVTHGLSGVSVCPLERSLERTNAPIRLQCFTCPPAAPKTHISHLYLFIRCFIQYR